MAKAKSKQTEVGINMTPMIDIVFQLIMFFMLASSYASAEVDMRIKVPLLGKESRAVIEDPRPPCRLVINLAADERDPRALQYIKVGPINIGSDFDQLRMALDMSKARAEERNQRLVLILRAHRTLAWSNVQQVMLDASTKGIKDIELVAPVGEWGSQQYKAGRK